MPPPDPIQPDGRGGPMLSVATAANDAPVSPTGKSIIPPALVPYAITLVGLAALVGALPTMGVPLPAPVLAGAGVVVALGALFGIASPGLRKTADSSSNNSAAKGQ